MKKFVLLMVVLSMIASVFGCGKAPQVSEPEEEVVDIPEEAPAEETVDTAALEEYNQWLESLFRGIVKLEERAGAYGDETLGGGTYMPMRFSKERIEAYKEYNSTAKIAAPYYNCTSGVRMDFYTDAKTISFSYLTQESFFDRSADHPDDCFAVFENGEFQQTYIAQYGSRLELSYERKSEAPESRITIVFPNWHGAALSDFQLGNARPCEEFDHRFLMLGASCDQGLFADKPSDNYLHIIAQEFNADYLNLSVGGEIYRKEAIDPNLEYEPTHIFVDLGGNDFYSGMDEATMKQNCYEYLETLKAVYPETPVTVITSFRDNKPASWIEAISSTAESLGCNVIIGSELVSQDAEYWNADLVHPASPGFASIAENMIPILKEYIA